MTTMANDKGSYSYGEEGNIVKENIVKVKENIVKGYVVKENIVQGYVVKENMVKENMVKENMVKENIVKENMVKENMVKEGYSKTSASSPTISRVSPRESPEVPARNIVEVEKIIVCADRPDGDAAGVAAGGDTKGGGVPANLEVLFILCLLFLFLYYFALFLV